MSLPGSWIAATIASSGTSSSAIDLGKVYDYLDIYLPTLTSCTLKLQVSEKLAGTYADLGSGVTTDTTTGGMYDVWELGGWQYIKVVSSATQGAERLIRVRGMAR